MNHLFCKMGLAEWLELSQNNTLSINRSRWEFRISFFLFIWNYGCELWTLENYRLILFSWILSESFGFHIRQTLLITTPFHSPEIVLEANKQQQQKIVWLKPVNNHESTSYIDSFLYVTCWYYWVHLIDAYRWTLQGTGYGRIISSRVLIGFYPSKSLSLSIEELLQILIC